MICKKRGRNLIYDACWWQAYGVGSKFFKILLGSLVHFFSSDDPFITWQTLLILPICKKMIYSTDHGAIFHRETSRFYVTIYEWVVSKYVHMCTSSYNYSLVLNHRLILTSRRVESEEKEIEIANCWWCQRLPDRQQKSYVFWWK